MVAHQRYRRAVLAAALDPLASLQSEQSGCLEARLHPRPRRRCVGLCVLLLCVTFTYLHLCACPSLVNVSITCVSVHHLCVCPSLVCLSIICISVHHLCLCPISVHSATIKGGDGICF